MSGPSLKAKIVNFRLMPSLIAATLATEKPTDGYLVNDIIKMSFESQQARLFVQEYLMNQLVSSRNVYVKTKVLKLFIDLVSNGHPEFRQNLLKQKEPIDDASKLRCNNPDLAGDVGRIRDLAKKLLDMVYDESVTNTPSSISSSSLSSGTYRATSNSSKYSGFGNTSVEPSKHPNRSILSGVLYPRKQQQPEKEYDSNYASMTPVPQNTGQNNVIRVVSAAPPSYTQGPTQYGKDHVKGEAGGGWQEQEKMTNSSSNRVEQTDMKRFQPSVEEQPASERESEEEQKVVDMVTAPGGVRAAPARDQLDHFIKKCKSLDVLIITDLLKEKLRSESQQVVLRTLFVLEAMLRSDIPSVDSCLDLTLDDLNVLCQSPHTSIKSKATKLMKQLGVTTASGVTVATSSGTMTTAPSNATDNILDLDTSSVADSNSYTEQQQSTTSMFEGLSVTNSNSVAPPTTSNNNTNLTSLFGDMSIQAPSASGQPLTADDDGLIDLGEQDMFDPLVRSSSLGSRNESLLRSSGSASSQSAFAFLKQSSMKGEELTSSGVLFEAPPTTSAQQQPQRMGVTGHTMQPPMMGMNIMSSYNMPSTVSGTAYQQQHQFPYSTTQQQQEVQNTSYHNQVPLLGNSARPVQLAHQTSNQDESSDSFSFLEKKSTKASAFDFVQDEMKARMKSS